jgi:hypothetical protein
VSEAKHVELSGPSTGGALVFEPSGQVIRVRDVVAVVPDDFMGRGVLFLLMGGHVVPIPGIDTKEALRLMRAATGAE